MAQTCSIYFTVAAAFDCYINVCWKSLAKSYCSMRRAKQVCFTVIVISILYNSLRFPQFNLRKCFHEASQEQIIEICPTSLFFTINTIYNVYMYMVLMTLLPFLFLLCLNAIILLRQSLETKKGKDSTSPSDVDVPIKPPVTPEGAGDDTVTMIMVVILFLACNTLALVVNMIETFTIPDPLVLNLLSDASNFLVVFNSSVNCVIYLVFNTEYREVFIHHGRHLMELLRREYCCFCVSRRHKQGLYQPVTGIQQDRTVRDAECGSGRCSPVWQPLSSRRLPNIDWSVGCFDPDGHDGLADDDSGCDNHSQVSTRYGPTRWLAEVNIVGGQPRPHIVVKPIGNHRIDRDTLSSCRVSALLLCGSVIADPESIDCSKLTVDQLTKQVLVETCDSAHHIAVEGGQTVPLDISDWSFYQISPLLNAKKLSISIKMYGNPTVRKLDFECTTCSSGVKDGFVLDARNNNVLKRISFNKLTSGLGTEKIDIRGNRLLKQDLITKLEGLRKGDASYVQKAGDCYFDGPVKTAAEVKGCKGVSSDLDLEGFEDAEIPVGENSETSIQYLEGCLRVVNTPLVDLSFLSADLEVKEDCTTSKKKTEVSGNAALCVNALISTQLGTIKAANNKPEGCSTTCVISEPVTPTVAAKLARTLDACTTLTFENTPPQLIITGHKSSSPTDKENLEKLFKDTKVISGSLTVEDNDIDHFDVFAKLTTVGNGEGLSTSDGPPIRIINNRIQAVSFPVLEGKSCSQIFKLDSKTTLINRAGECNGGIFMADSLMNYANLGMKCDLYCGDVTIRKFSESNKDQLKFFKDMKAISGSLTIEDNEIELLDVFGQLTTVGNGTSSGPTITIINNKLQAVSFPALDGKSCSHAKIFFTDNNTLINRAGECNSGIFTPESGMNYANLHLKCDLYCGDVTIRKFSEPNKDKLTFFKDTKVIYGYLTIEDNDIDLLDVFAKLTTVGNGTSSGPSIMMNNNRLQAASFPMLTGKNCSHAKIFKVDSNTTLINRAGDCNGGIFLADALMKYVNLGVKCYLFCGDATIQNFDELNVDQVNLFKAAKVISGSSLIVENDHKKIGSCPGYVFTPESMQNFTEANWWCYSFSGDVTIQNFNESNKYQLKFFNVTKVISGSLIVENNHFESFDFFWKLTTIGNETYSQPAMKIVNNSFLAVYFPELADNIYSKTQKVVFLIEGNDNLNLISEQVEEFQRMAGDEVGELGSTYFQYDKMPKPQDDLSLVTDAGDVENTNIDAPLSTTNTSIGVQQMQQQPREYESTTTVEDTKGDGLGTGVIIGIVCGAVAAVAIVGGVIFCACTNKLCFKKGGANNAAPKTGSTDKTPTSASKDVEKGAGSAVGPVSTDTQTPSKIADKTPEGSNQSVTGAAASVTGAPASAAPAAPTAP